MAVNGQIPKFPPKIRKKIHIRVERAHAKALLPFLTPLTRPVPFTTCFWLSVLRHLPPSRPGSPRAPAPASIPTVHPLLPTIAGTPSSSLHQGLPAVALAHGGSAAETYYRAGYPGDAIPGGVHQRANSTPEFSLDLARYLDGAGFGPRVEDASDARCPRHVLAAIQADDFHVVSTAPPRDCSHRCAASTPTTTNSF